MALITCPDCKAEISDAAPACPRCGRPAAAAASAPRSNARGAGVQTETAERVLFEDSAVTVTNVRVLVNATGTTFATANITSVREFVEPRPPGLALLGFMATTLGIFCVGVQVADSASVGWVVGAVGVLCLLLYTATKPKHWVRVATAGTESNAIWSHDPLWTRTVVGAVNDAIVARG